MKIVIDIPKEMWERIKDGYVPLGISKYLKNGIPLREGHGRLIDADALKVSTGTIDDWAVEEFVYLDEIEDAPTIVEAEKEAET